MQRRKQTARGRTRDLQVEEFEARDLGPDIAASGVRLMAIRGRSRPRSIALDDALVEALRAKGAKRGLGYQTMLKLIVREHLDEY